MVLTDTVNVHLPVKLSFKAIISNLPNNISRYKTIIFVILVRIPCPFGNIS